MWPRAVLEPALSVPQFPRPSDGETLAVLDDTFSGPHSVGVDQAEWTQRPRGRGRVLEALCCVPCVYHVIVGGRESIRPQREDGVGQEARAGPQDLRELAVYQPV